jgi:capsule biosynthesis phosphatase
MAKNIVIDLDDTLTSAGSENDEYENLLPNSAVVEKLIFYKSEGFNISIYTARNMRSFNNSVGMIAAYTLPKIIQWLNKHKIPYDEIYIGKPWCGFDGFYVDDKAIRPDEFVTLNYDQIKELIQLK